MDKLIKDLISHFNGLSYIDVEDSGEGKLYGISVDYIDTLQMDEDKYNKWTDMLDSIDVINLNFQIYCSYDKSGHCFWNNNMKESNYTYIDIWISDAFCDNDINSLYNELKKVVEYIDNFYFN
jgi:hypothetical protein